MPRALVLGGSGAVGRAVARRLLGAGWDVEVTGRDRAHLPAPLLEAGARFIASDRGSAADLRALAGADRDLLVDCVCFTGRQARELLPLAREAASTVLISSKAVYVDAHGNHSNSDDPPDYGGPVTEAQSTLPPGDGDHRTREGYGRNKVAAEAVLLDSGLPVTVLRASKIHGEGARPPREWVFVRRVLDRRPVVVLADRGRGTDHPSAAANIAALVELAWEQPAARILNAADPDAPDGLRIARTVAAHLGHEWREVLLEPDADVPGALGRHPWDRPHPVVLDMSAARALGWSPAGDYATTVTEELDWLVAPSVVSSGDPSGEPDGPRLPEGQDDEWCRRYFDYAAEDRYLAGG